MKRACLTILAALLLWPALVSAHDVPDVVRISILLKAENGRMRMLVRVPANAFIDFMFPMFEDGGLDLTQADAVAADGAQVWIADILPLFENGAAIPRPTVLKTRISRMNDPFFNSFDDALSHMDAPRLAPDTYVTQDQAAVDALLETPITSASSVFSYEPRFGRLGVLVYSTLTFLAPDGEVRKFFYEGDPDTFALNPGRGYVVRHFLQAGFAHYFTDTIYLLFAVSVALVFRRVRALLPFVAALVAAESVALIVFLGVMPSAPWLPVIAAALIAAATTYMGIEAIVAGDGARVSLAIGAGLILGSSFWCALQPNLQFAGSHQVASALGFGAGVVSSELLAVAAAIAAAAILLKLSRAPLAVVVIAAAVVIHIAWRRMLDRIDAFSLVPASAPPVNMTVLAAIGIVAAAAVVGRAVYLKRRQRGFVAPAH
jgi:hypothetical protein